MCRRLKLSELTRSDSNAWTEVDAEASLARFRMFPAAACGDSTYPTYPRPLLSFGRIMHTMRVVAFLLAFGTASVAAQNATLPAPTPAAAIRAIVEALRTHDIVAVGDPHGNMQV